MSLLVLILLILALASFVVAAFGWVAGKVNFIGLGLAFWVFSEILARWPN